MDFTQDQPDLIDQVFDLLDFVAAIGHGLWYSLLLVLVVSILYTAFDNRYHSKEGNDE